MGSRLGAIPDRQISYRKIRLGIIIWSIAPDDYSAAVIANRKGAPLTQALVPSKHPTTDDLFP